MASTNRLTYVYNVDGHTIEVTRRHVRTAYAANGNVSNPTEYFVWDVRVDEKAVITGRATRADAYEHGLAKIRGTRYSPCDDRGLGGINVRNFMLVRNEMKKNYVKRVSE